MLRIGLSLLSIFRHQRTHQPHHPGQKRQPEQGAADVEGGVGIGDLPGNDFQLRALGGDELHQPDEPGQQHRRQQAPAEVEAAVGQRGAGGVLPLPDAGQQSRDRRADVVP